MVKVAALKIPVIGLTGAGSGMAIGTLAAEYTSRATGQVGWYAFGVKGLVKLGIGSVTYLGSTKLGLNHATAGFFVETLAYGCLGSIFMDLAIALYPGGIAGLAEDWAMTTRTLAAGGRKITQQLTAIEQQQMASRQKAAPTMVQSKGWY